MCTLSRARTPEGRGRAPRPRAALQPAGAPGGWRALLMIATYTPCSAMGSLSLALCVISAFVEFCVGGRSCGRSRKWRPGCLSCRKARDLSSVQKAYRGIGKKCELNINLNMGWKKSLALGDLCKYRDSATVYFKYI